MKDLENLINLINSYSSDIKAEVLIADLIQEGFLPSDFLIFFDSGFKRGYSKDILKAGKFPINNIQDTLAVYLSRDGLYDLLPEGLFHASPDSALSSGKGMASDSKKETKIEEETRKFFLPFENEFFYQRVQLELQERTILQKLNDNNLDDFFLDFWKIDRSLPKELIIKLSAMLPFAREIVGDFEMTANCLGAILEEDVTHKIQYSKSYTETNRGHKDEKCSLGKTSLGVNFIIGAHLPENCKLIRFSIGPLKNNRIDSFLEKGDIAHFIDCFCNYFIPMEMDVEFDVIMPKELQNFVLGSDKTTSIMGYSTVI
ncbi:MAG: type VI secretion system baseplate subunit TssG [Bacteroidales bacterium]|nr:type VI secretion system baseplate subunit TssG [Bacteroidales bacterium]